MSAPEPQLDLTKINFPTDRLSIKDLRTMFPEGFDRLDQWGRADGAEFFRDQSDRGYEILIWMLNTERKVAELAFNRATGRPQPEDRSERSPGWVEEEKEELIELLVKYGLATGPRHAEQQVRDIESQAATQAIGFGPRPRT
jgi:hypothetical protein